MTTPQRSRRWILPLLLVVLWLVVGGPLGSLAGQLSEVQENDNAAFLPQSAESTQALEALRDFQPGDTFPTTVVFTRDDGVTPADRAAIETLTAQLGDLDLVAGVDEPVAAPDGSAVQVVVQVAVAPGEDSTAGVEEIRDVLADAPDGLRALVGGQGGILADFLVAFGAIDGLLLLTALSVVLVILLLVYRSPVLPLIVLTSSVLALGVGSAAVYGLADAGALTVNGQSQGILFVLAVGAATDYALLLVARYREALRDHVSPYDAMRVAWRGSVEPILASGTTVILGLLCLLLSDLSSLRGLGPVGAFGVAGAMLAALTFLPAALVLLGRRAFWPIPPAYGSPHPEQRSMWGRLAGLIARRARAVWSVTLAALLVAAAFFVTFDEDPVPQTELFLSDVESVRAQKVLDRSFEADSASPLQLVVPVEALPDVVALTAEQPGVATDLPGGRPAVLPLPDPVDPTSPLVIDGRALVFAVLTDAADSAAAAETVRALRTALDEVSPETLVGGAAAINVDVRDTTNSDRMKAIPAILLVIFLVLVLLLRSVVAPLLLLAVNVLSFASTIGISALVFNHVLGLPPSDPATLLIAFVFLVALGIDYSIFLMTRVREEALLQGTRPGILRGLSVTGGVITSAGIVLAATFSALGVIPILFLAQIAFIVAFGVLLDAIVVRSLLVPALCHDLGRVIWWPSRLAREDPVEEPSH